MTPSMGPLNRHLNEVRAEKQAYLEAARQDIDMRRGMHNSQIQAIQKQEKSAKKKVWIASMADKFSHLGERVGKMGPQ